MHFENKLKDTVQKSKDNDGAIQTIYIDMNDIDDIRPILRQMTDQNDYFDYVIHLKFAKFGSFNKQNDKPTWRITFRTNTPDPFVTT